MAQQCAAPYLLPAADCSRANTHVEPPQRAVFPLSLRVHSCPFAVTFRLEYPLAPCRAGCERLR